MMQWLRSRFIAGFFLTVPLFVSVAALVWIFGIIDGSTAPLAERLLGRTIPGLGSCSPAARAAGRCRLRPTSSAAGFWRGRELADADPVFRTIYAPVKQLLRAFSPDNEYGFKRVVMVEDPAAAG
jgi:uncharacterized membrane protein